VHLVANDVRDALFARIAMTPAELFEKAENGSRIRYGSPEFPIIVTVGFIARNSVVKYFHGIEEGTDRKVFAILEGDRLKDAHRGYFEAVAIIA
jgi:hypothetical protein